jgi:putative spermidine/putrescine transport system permease protein
MADYSPMAPAEQAGTVTRDRYRLSVWHYVIAPPLALLAAIFALPMADLMSVSFHQMSSPGQIDRAFTLANYKVFLTDPFFLSILLRTGELGLIVVGCSLIIAYPVAYYLARANSRWRSLVLFLVISPLLVSAIVRNIGWYPILSDSGLVNSLLLRLGLISSPVQMISNFTGVVIGLLHALLPFMILTLTTVLQRIERELEEAAANLGAGPIRVFWHVLLPLSLPGVVSGSLLVFTMAISAYTTPAILGGNRVLVMATYIAQQFRTVLDYPSGATAAAILLVCASLLMLLVSKVHTSGSPA